MFYIRYTPILAISAVATSLMVNAIPAHANEHPRGETRQHIEGKLHSLGFVRWGEIERSDIGRAWKIDDAYMQNGPEYELRLSVEDLHEIRRHRDDHDHKGHDDDD